MLKQVNLPRRADDTNVPAPTECMDPGPIEDEIEEEIVRQDKTTAEVRYTEFFRRFPTIIEPV